MQRGSVVLLWFVASVTLAAQQWPSFRGPNASGVAEGNPVATTWNASTGENIRWTTPVPGVAVSSPIVWGDRVFVSTAVGSDPKAGIRTGLYGDVEPVEDKSRHEWRLLALDKQSGKVIWDRLAYAGYSQDEAPPEIEPGIANAGDRRAPCDRLVRLGRAVRLRFRWQVALEA